MSGGLRASPDNGAGSRAAFGQKLARGENVLLVDWSHMSFTPPVGADQFERCELLDQQPVWRLGRQIAHFNFMLCQNWQGPIGLPLDAAR